MNRWRRKKDSYSWLKRDYLLDPSPSWTRKTFVIGNKWNCIQFVIFWFFSFLFGLSFSIQTNFCVNNFSLFKSILLLMMKCISTIIFLLSQCLCLFQYLIFSRTGYLLLWPDHLLLFHVKHQKTKAIHLNCSKPSVCLLPISLFSTSLFPFQLWDLKRLHFLSD